MKKTISDSTFSFLWDKWKSGDSSVYDRYNRYWTLQIAVTGWVLYVLRKGITPQYISSSEVYSCITILLLVSLLGIYIVRLMKSSLYVRNSYNPEIVSVLLERGILSIPVDDKNKELRDWSPKNFSHKWNNWHAAPTKVWQSSRSVDTMRGTTTSMIVVYILCIINVSFSGLLVWLNIY